MKPRNKKKITTPVSRSDVYRDYLRAQQGKIKIEDITKKYKIVRQRVWQIAMEMENGTDKPYETFMQAMKYEGLWLYRYSDLFRAVKDDSAQLEKLYKRMAADGFSVRLTAIYTGNSRESITKLIS